MSTEVSGHLVLVQHWHESSFEGKGWAVQSCTDDWVVTCHYQVVSPAWSKRHTLVSGMQNKRTNEGI